jgi:hypothetical protein
VSDWRVGQATHTRLTPGRRRRTGSTGRGLVLGMVLAPFVWGLVALTIWAARELLG